MPAKASRGRLFRPRRWALLLLLGVGAAVAYHLFLPAGFFPADERRVLLIRRGETVRDIAAELERVGLVRGTLGFQLLARITRVDRDIKAGQYSFQLGTTVPGRLRALTRGMSGLNLVTIPEGLTLREMLPILSSHLGVPETDFDSLARSRPFLDSLGIAAPDIEGYLAPDSYEFLPGTAPEVAFRTMAKRAQQVLVEAAAGRDSLPLGMSLHGILTLASIIECEAQVDDERPRIARVYLNRLTRGMRLQADPTVAYGVGMRPRSKLLLRHLRIDSPYNTYLHAGLPAGPICNPGRKSIEAVLLAGPEGNELYFVAMGEGRHRFAATYEEHLTNIREVRSTTAAAAPETLTTEAMLIGEPIGPANKPGAGAATKPATGTATKPATGTATKPATGTASKSGTAATTKSGTGAATKTGASATTKPTTTAAKPAASATNPASKPTSKPATATTKATRDTTKKTSGSSR